MDEVTQQRSAEPTATKPTAAKPVAAKPVAARGAAVGPARGRNATGKAGGPVGRLQAALASAFAEDQDWKDF